MDTANDPPLEDSLLDSFDQTDSELEDDEDDSTEYERSWLDMHLMSKANIFLCDVDDEFMTDRFNLTGLQNEVPEFQRALDIICEGTMTGATSQHPVDATELQLQAASELYGLIHARFIMTSRGLAKMLEKVRKGTYGQCPRVLCEHQNLIPVGLTDIPRVAHVKLFCSSCEDIYHPTSVSPSSTFALAARMDGSYFGASFPHMLLQSYPQMVVPVEMRKPRYIPKIYGFKIYKGVGSKAACA